MGSNKRDPDYVEMLSFLEEIDNKFNIDDMEEA